MKKLYVVLIIAITVFLCGCKQNGALTTTESGTEVTTESGTETTTESSTEETTTKDTTEETTINMTPMDYVTQGEGMAKKLCVSKTLIFFTETPGTSGVNQEIYEKFNELLVNKYGCDFTVEFRGYNPFDGAKYQNELRRKQATGEQVDIIYTGAGTQTFDGTYTAAVKDGLLEPLGAMLETEYGKKLWKSYPENVWTRVHRDGDYYGVFNECWGETNPVIIINSKYITDESVVKNIKTLDDVYAFLDSLGEIEEGVIPLVADLDDMYEFEGGYVFGEWVIGKENNGKWEACFALEDDKYISYMEALKKYGAADGISQDSAEKLGKFVVLIGKKIWRFYDGESFLIKQSLESTDYDDTIAVYECASAAERWADSYDNGIVGIASWSQYKEEALQFLALLASEPELSNLLTFGLEGVHYTLENDRVVYIDYDGSNGRAPIRICTMGNYMITNPYALEPFDKIDAYDSYKVKRGLVSLYGIEMSDYNSIEYRIQSIRLTDKRYTDWQCQDNNMELLEELRTKAKNAGIEKMINDINEQLKGAQK